MKKLFVAFLSLCATSSFAQTDAFELSDFYLAAGKTNELKIGLKNPTNAYTAFQLDVTLPEGVTIVKGEDDEYEVSLNEKRISADEDGKHIIAVGDVGDNTYRFVCYSMKNKVISETEGDLISVKLDVPENTDKDQNVNLKGSLLVTPEIVTSEPEAYMASVTISEVGDVNVDGDVDILDAVQVIKFYFKRPLKIFNKEAADINDDGEIDVLDAVKIIKKGFSSSASVRVSIDQEGLKLDPQ